MKTLLDSGLSGIFLGVESFNEKDLEVFSKTSSVQENISAIEYFIKYPINVDIGFINFHPYSTLEGLRTNAYYLHKYGYSGRFLLIKALRLFKGTDIYNKVEKDNLIKHEDEFNVYQYNFKDKRISLLYDVINNYFNVLNENTNLAQNINYYFNDHLDVMAHLKRYFNKIEDKIALELVNEYEKSVKYYLMELNNINTKWFMEMIDEAENNTSDKNIYLDIMEKHLSAEMLKEINRRLDNNKLLFYRNISKINKEYVRLF